MIKLLCKYCQQSITTNKLSRKYCNFSCMGKDMIGDKNVIKRPEVLEKMRQSMMGKFAGKKHPMWGKKHTLNTRLKMSQAHTGVKLSEYHRKKQGEGRKNSKNPNWKGNKVGYNALHTWIHRHLGQPNTCKQCGKSGLFGQKIHWANKNHKYKRDKSDWIRLCASCHKKIDLAYRKKPE